MDETRRNILKLFGVAASAGVAGTAVARSGPLPDVSCEPLANAVRAWKNPYELPFSAPRGMVYQWKRMFVTGDTPDMGNIAMLQEAGWKPVPMRRHSEHFRSGTADSDENVYSYWIEIGGLVLMEKAESEIGKPRAHPVPEQEPSDVSD
jgi:hypothetical protein